MNNLKLITVSLVALLALGCGGGSDGSSEKPNTGDPVDEGKNGDGGDNNNSDGGDLPVHTGKPIIRLNGLNPVTVFLNTTYTDAGATAQDPDDGALSPSIKDSNVKTTLIGDYTVLYAVKDSDNNEVTKRRTVKVRYPNPNNIPKTGQKVSKGQKDDGYYQSGEARNYVRDNSVGVVKDMTSNLTWQDDKVSVTKTQSEAQLYCTNLTLGNFIDWRLPSVKELTYLSEVNDKDINKAFKYISNVSNRHNFYWSSTPNKYNSDESWVVEGYYSETNANSDNWYVRCVRGDDKTSSHRLSRDAKGIVTDNNTKLQWQDNYDDNNGVIKGSNWQDAISYCESLTLDGGHWRMPNINEVISIVDFSKNKPAIDTTVFINTDNDKYWSSTKDGNNAWYIDFRYGIVRKSYGYNDTRIRCVRSANISNAGGTTPPVATNHDGLYKVSTHYTGGTLSTSECMGDVAVIGIEVKGTDIIDMNMGMIINKGDLKLNQNTIAGTLKDGTVWSGNINSNHHMSGTYNFRNGGCNGTFTGVKQ